MCETNIDDCAEAVCQNQGTCTDGVNMYTCACTADWMGDVCDQVSVHLAQCQVVHCWLISAGLCLAWCQISTLRDKS